MERWARRLSKGRAVTRGGGNHRPHFWLDSSAIKRDVGWEPKIGWQEGLGEMVSWGRKYLGQLKDWPKDYVLRG